MFHSHVLLHGLSPLWCMCIPAQYYSIRSPPSPCMFDRSGMVPFIVALTVWATPLEGMPNGS